MEQHLPVHEEQSRPAWYRWTCWLVAAMIYFFQYGLLIFPAAIGADLQQSLHISAVGIGLLSSAFLLPYVAIQIPVGVLYDRFNARYLLAICAFLMAFGCLILVHSHNLAQGLLSRILMGLGGGFAFVGALYVGKSRFPPEMFPLIIGLTEAISGLGEFGLSYGFALLNRLHHWRFVVLEVAVILFVLGVLAAFYLRDKSPPKHRQQTSQELFQALRYIFTHPKIWLLSLYTGFSYSQFVVMTDLWGVPFLQVRYHMQTTRAVFDNDMVIIGFTLGCIFIGVVARYVKERYIILFGSIFQLILIVLASYLTPNIYIEGTMLLMLGIFTANVVICFDMAKRTVGEHSYGFVAGFINMFYVGFGILINPIVGLLYYLFQNLYIAIIPVMVCSFVAVLLAILIFRDRQWDHVTHGRSLEN